MQQGKVKTINAVVVSTGGDKSISVLMDYKVRHPKYGKYVRRRTKLRVHDERNEAGLGDVVEVSKCRPYSKTKSFRLVRVVQKAVQQ